MDYYIYKNDQNLGPLPENEVIGGIRTGRYLSNDLGCRVGDSDWKDLSILFPLETAVPLAPVPQQVFQQPPQKVIQPPQQRIVHEPQVIYQPAMTMNGSSDVTRLMYFEANKKSTATAFLLWFFLCGFGAHRIYMGKIGTGILQAGLWWFSVILCWILIGFLIIWIPLLWFIIDAFLISSWVTQHNNKLLTQANSFR